MIYSNKYLKNLLFCAIAIILLPSCRLALAKMVYGVKKYKPRKIEQIEHYAKKHGLVNLPNYVLDTTSLFTLLTKYKGTTSLGSSSIFVFDSLGNQLQIKGYDRGSDSFCSSSIFQLIAQTPQNLAAMDSNRLVKSNLLRNARRLENSAAEQVLLPKYSYIIFWSISAGRLNKDLSLAMAEALQYKKDSNISIAFLNIDMVR